MKTKILSVNIGIGNVLSQHLAFSLSAIGGKIRKGVLHGEYGRASPSTVSTKRAASASGRPAGSWRAATV
jgi:hypothetical protein